MHNLKHFLLIAIQLPVKALSRIAVSDNSEKFQPTTSTNKREVALQILLVCMWFCCLGGATRTSRKQETTVACYIIVGKFRLLSH